MNASDIQKVVLACLRAVNATLYKSSIGSLSDNPAEPNVPQTVKANMFIVSALMTRDEYNRFVDCCEKLSVKIVINKPFLYGNSPDIFEYDIAAYDLVKYLEWREVQEAAKDVRREERRKSRGKW
jgi:hypothetical protein